MERNLARRLTALGVRFCQLAQRSGQLDVETLAHTSVDRDAHLLDKLRLKEGAYFKRTTALLFVADPQRFVALWLGRL